MAELNLIDKHLDQLYDKSPVLHLSASDKIVIFSDLHMGDGSTRDDFTTNARLFQYVLENQYLHGDYTLILNGDVEELQRFSYEDISRHWRSVYHLFDAFASHQRLYKTIGNHDYELILKTNHDSPYKHLNSLLLKYKDNDIFIFHGHQASTFYTQHNALAGFFLRFVANPFGIKNYSVAHNSRKQYKIEKRVYSYSSEHKLASIIGHTHRPLFESMSKLDTLKYHMERLLRSLPNVSMTEAERIKSRLRAYRDELTNLLKIKQNSLMREGLYSTGVLVPCLFNSGCVIGKRGITSIEITNAEIALVYYFDRNISNKHLREDGENAVQMGETDYYRLVIQKESLDYIFTRIKLLA